MRAQLSAILKATAASILLVPMAFFLAQLDAISLGLQMTLRHARPNATALTVIHRARTLGTTLKSLTLVTIPPGALVALA